MNGKEVDKIKELRSYYFTKCDRLRRHHTLYNNMDYHYQRVLYIFMIILTQLVGQV